MAVEIRIVEGRRALRRFVRFPEKLYRDNEYYVPNLVFDEMSTLNPKKNPASAFCDSALYMAYKDGEPVGRVAAIMNHKANEQWNHKEVRFGWFDFIDDREVSAALLAKVEEFGRQHGADSIVGPLGFTDFDPEGMLVEGFDRLCTMALIYNHPYYKDHVEALGFEKEADWIEYRINLQCEVPEKVARIAKIIPERYNVHLRPVTRKMIREENYAQKVFKLINDCYSKLYNYTVMPEEMADKYIGFYLGMLDLKYISVVENDKGELVAFGVVMPSIVRALQKCRGKLFPFGWFHVVKSLYLKHEDTLEMLLIGVHPDHQNTGLNALIVDDLFRKVHEEGCFHWGETNAVLETNTKNQAHWALFENECKKRRRSYKKMLV